jgi:hypothetical protein
LLVRKIVKLKNLQYATYSFIKKSYEFEQFIKEIKKILRVKRMIINDFKIGFLLNKNFIMQNYVLN